MGLLKKPKAGPSWTTAGKANAGQSYQKDKDEYEPVKSPWRKLVNFFSPGYYKGKKKVIAKQDTTPKATVNTKAIKGWTDDKEIDYLTSPAEKRRLKLEEELKKNPPKQEVAKLNEQEAKEWAPSAPVPPGAVLTGDYKPKYQGKVEPARYQRTTAAPTGKTEYQKEQQAAYDGQHPTLPSKSMMDKFKEYMSGEGRFQPAAGYAHKAYEAITDPSNIGKAWEGIKGLPGNMKNAYEGAKNLPSKLKDAYANAEEADSDKIGASPWDQAKSIYNNPMGTLKSIVNGIGSEQDALNRAADESRATQEGMTREERIRYKMTHPGSLAGEYYQGLRDLPGNAWEGIKGLGGKIKNAYNNASVDEKSKIGNSLLEQMMSVYRNPMGAVKQTGNELSQTYDYLKDKAGQAYSGMKDTYNKGKNLPSYGEGFKGSQMEGQLNALKGLAKPYWDKITAGYGKPNEYDQYGKNVHDKFQGLNSGVSGAAKSFWNKITSGYGKPNEYDQYGKNLHDKFQGINNKVKSGFRGIDDYLTKGSLNFPPNTKDMTRSDLMKWRATHPDAWAGEVYTEAKELPGMAWDAAKRLGQAGYKYGRDFLKRTPPTAPVSTNRTPTAAEEYAGNTQQPWNGQRINAKQTYKRREQAPYSPTAGPTLPTQQRMSEYMRMNSEGR
jgi:hypothetical protein